MIFVFFALRTTRKWLFSRDTLIDARNRISTTISSDEKKLDQKILFFRGEISISILRRGENFLVKPKLKKIPTKHFGRDILTFMYTVGLG